ncbi:MAG: CopG family antitoxin [Caldilineales bacterium]
MARTINTHELPNTDSIDELARFWDSHDLTDFEDELEEVNEPVFVRREKAVLHLHLSQQELDRLNQIASAREMDSDILVHEWVLEKLQTA